MRICPARKWTPPSWRGWPAPSQRQKPFYSSFSAHRRVVAATPAVCAALTDANEPLRLAAIAAFGRLAELKDLDVLAGKAMAASSPAESAAAQAALKMAVLRMSDRDACAAKLADALKGASAANQKYLLELLGKVSGQKALETVVVSVKSSDPAIKDAATRVLGEWLSAEAAAALLEIARHDADAKYQTRALRGYIRIARQLKLPAETRLAMFRTAMELAKRNDEKKIALEILPRIPSVTTLDLVVSYVGAASLKTPAADAAVKIAAKIVGREPKAVAAATAEGSRRQCGRRSGQPRQTVARSSQSRLEMSSVDDVARASPDWGLVHFSAYRDRLGTGPFFGLKTYFCEQTVGRKYGPVPFPQRKGSSLSRPAR